MLWLTRTYLSWEKTAQKPKTKETKLTLTYTWRSHESAALLPPNPLLVDGKSKTVGENNVSTSTASFLCSSVHPSPKSNIKKPLVLKGAHKYSANMGRIIYTKVTGSPQILMKLIKNCIKGEKAGLFNSTSGKKNSFRPITRKKAENQKRPNRRPP